MVKPDTWQCDRTRHWPNDTSALCRLTSATESDEGRANYFGHIRKEMIEWQAHDSPVKTVHFTNKMWNSDKQKINTAMQKKVFEVCVSDLFGWFFFLIIESNREASVNPAVISLPPIYIQLTAHEQSHTCDGAELTACECLCVSNRLLPMLLLLQQSTATQH